MPTVKELKAAVERVCSDLTVVVYMEAIMPT